MGHLVVCNRGSHAHCPLSHLRDDERMALTHSTPRLRGIEQFEVMLMIFVDLVFFWTRVTNQTRTIFVISVSATPLLLWLNSVSLILAQSERLHYT